MLAKVETVTLILDYLAALESIAKGRMTRAAMIECARKALADKEPVPAPQKRQNVWHVVKPADRARISCQERRAVNECTQPATCCEHEEGGIGISFHYYCQEHGIARGFKG